MTISNEELLRHCNLAEQEYKSAIKARDEWMDEQRDDCDMPNWLFDWVERTRIDFEVFYELAVRRGLLPEKEAA